MKAKLVSLAAAAATLALGVATPAGAQSAYPAKPVRMLVGQPPGGPTDLAARVFADKLRDQLGQPIVVENRPGAAAQISILQTAQAAPDGYTLNYVGPGITTLPVLSKTYNIDSLKDLTLISRIVNLSVAVMVTSSLPVRNLDEFVADLKANPGKRFYANMGATDLMTMTVFLQTLAVPYEVVRFNGAAPGFQSLFAGDTHFTYTTVGVAKPHADAGKLRLLLVTGSKRSPLAPDVPAVGESKNPAVRALADSVLGGSWFGLIGPASLPKDIVDRLYNASARVTRDADFGKRMADLALEPVGGTPQEFEARVRRDLETYRAVAKQLNIEAQ
jgi:tripartite-type tricarboxylate transporter receptor subunit TctC